VALRLPGVDQHGQIVDVYFSARRNADAARRFLAGAVASHGAMARW
jgi:transposase-like protein